MNSFEGLLVGILIVLVGAMILIQLFRILAEVKKGNKDQQEIKARLYWVKERQLKEGSKYAKI